MSNLSTSFNKFLNNLYLTKTTSNANSSGKIKLLFFALVSIIAFPFLKVLGKKLLSLVNQVYLKKKLDLSDEKSATVFSEKVSPDCSQDSTPKKEGNLSISNPVESPNLPTQNAAPQLTEEAIKDFKKMLQDGNTEGLETFFLQNPNFLQNSENHKLCLYNCTSIKTAQLLVKHGLDIKSLDKKVAENLVECLKYKSNKDLSLLEFYAQQGLHNLFQMNNRSCPIIIELVGNVHPLTKNSLDQYLAFPTITQQLHSFVLTTVSQNPYYADSCLFFYCTKGDAEGIKSLMQLIEQRQLQNQVKNQIAAYFVTAVRLGHDKVVETLLSFIPISQLAENGQKEMMSLVCERGYPRLAKILQEKGCACHEKDRLEATNLCQWFDGVAEKHFPALTHHQSYDRTLNKAHLALYGNENTQQKYREEQRASLKFALKLMNKAKKSGDTGTSFHDFLDILGFRRQSTAHRLSTRHTNHFGTRRYEDLLLPTGGGYEHYRERLFSNTARKLKLDGISYEIKQKEGEEIWHIYNNFWDKKDPLCAYSEKLFNQIIKGEFKDEYELKNKVARFHWILANNPPFIRGTASILEVITDAMWIFHGFIPQPIEQGKSLDLEALSTDMTQFSELYPMGKNFLNHN
jgi:uncharacterized protein YecT (DUF1311 family)